MKGSREALLGEPPTILQLHINFTLSNLKILIIKRRDEHNEQETFIVRSPRNIKKFPRQFKNPAHM